VDLFGLAANWHHLLPQQFRMEFFNAGITNIDAKEFGWIVEFDFHTGKNGLHPTWNQKWKNFFEKNPKPTKAAILRQLELMKKSPEFKDLIQKGKPAKLGHKEWLEKLRQVRKKVVEEGAKELLEKGGTKGGKKLAKKVPIVGILFLLDDINRKGIVGGTANNLLDQVPYLGWVKMTECITGDWIPDK
jgi:hypothetical protein